MLIELGKPHPLLANRVGTTNSVGVVVLADGCLMLLVCLHSATDAEVRAMAHGEVVLGLKPLPPFGYVLVLEAGRIECEFQFAPRMQPPGYRKLREGPNLPITVQLVELPSTRVLVMRSVLLGQSFTRLLKTSHDMAAAEAETFTASGWDAVREAHMEATPRGPHAALDDCVGFCLISGAPKE